MAVIAYFFSGPSSARTGMGAAHYNALPMVRAALDGADREFKEKKEDYKATKACFVGPDSALARSSYAGPGLLALAWGLCQALREKHVMPSMVAGAGYGDVLALVAGRVLRFEDALFFLRRRGELLEAEYQKAPYHVVTVTGMPVEKLEGALEALDPRPRVVGYHGGDACTLAGDPAMLEKLAALLKSHKARAGAVAEGMDWPHPALAAAAPRVEALFAGLKLERSGAREMFSSVTGERVERVEELPGLMARACVEPVRFGRMVEAMKARGMDTAVEIGPGSALRAFVHRMDTGIRVLDTSDMKGFAGTVKLAN